MICLECPKGFSCPANGLAAPVSCENGTYQNESKSVECLECPAGFQCSNVDQTPTPCPSGSYSLLGSLHCLSCPAGFRYPFILSVTKLISKILGEAILVKSVNANLQYVILYANVTKTTNFQLTS